MDDDIPGWIREHFQAAFLAGAVGKPVGTFVSFAH
jgi:hypothetical protein